MCASLPEAADVEVVAAEGVVAGLNDSFRFLRARGLWRRRMVVVVVVVAELVVVVELVMLVVLVEAGGSPLEV